MTDWTGNKNSVFKTLGASNHTEKERQANDYYATDPIAAELLLQQEEFYNIWECASGENHLADVFKRHGYDVRTSDIIQRTPTTEVYDFLSIGNTSWDGDIITNPPYKLATEFIYKALSIISDVPEAAVYGGQREETFIHELSTQDNLCIEQQNTLRQERRV